MDVPQFVNFGKSVKDLFKKKFDVKSEVKVVSSANGVLIETGGFLRKGLVGFSKANWKQSGVGAFEVEGDSDGGLRGKVISNKISCATVTVEANTANCGTLSVEAACSKDSMAGSVKVNHGAKDGKTLVKLSGVLGHDGISVGGSVDIDPADISCPKDYNIGAECTSPSLTATIVTSNQLQDITASYFQNISKQTKLGAELLVKPDSQFRSFTFGGEWEKDPRTFLKLKANTSGVVSSAITHELSDLNVKLGAAADFNSQSSDIFAPQKFCLSVSFGQF